MFVIFMGESWNWNKVKIIHNLSAEMNGGSVVRLEQQNDNSQWDTGVAAHKGDTAPVALVFACGAEFPLLHAADASPVC